MANFRSKTQIFLSFIWFNISLIASAPQVNPPAAMQGGGSSPMQGFETLFGLGARYSAQNQFSETIRALNPPLSAQEVSILRQYVPVVTFLDEMSESQKRKIRSEALEKCWANNNTSTTNYWSNIQTIILDPSKQYMTDADREKMQQDIARGMTSQMRQITHPMTTILENALTMGLAMGIADCMQKIIGESCSRVVNKVPGVFTFVNRIAGKGYNVLCKRPDPLQPEEVLIWEQSFECLINSLCEHNVSGNLMLKNIRVSDDDQSGEMAADVNWLFLSQTIRQMCGHINEFFGERMLYYTGCKHQRQLLVGLSNAVSVENRSSIAFVIGMIMNNLKQLVQVCERAQSSDDLDRVHVKKLGRITLLLFNKLRVMIGGGSNSGLSSVGGAAYQTNSGLIEH